MWNVKCFILCHIHHLSSLNKKTKTKPLPWSDISKIKTHAWIEMYGLYNSKCIFTYSPSWMICRSCHTSGIGQMIFKYQSIKTDLGLACSLCQDFSFFPWEKNYLLAPSGYYNALMQQNWQVIPTGITYVISITLHVLVILTMYQVYCAT